MPMTRSRVILFAAGLLWLCAVSVGLGVLYEYKAKPGALQAAPAVWPAASRILRAQEHPTLVVFAHPQCPCTRATLGELALLIARVRDRVLAYVVFVRPAGFEDGWQKTDLWQAAEAIPGVQVLDDKEGGIEAARFGAVVSGQTMLFDRAGPLLFNGGITVARGHVGQSPGRSAIVSLVTTGQSEQNTASVFGCTLQDPDAMSLKTERSWKK